VPNGLLTSVPDGGGRATDVEITMRRHNVPTSLFAAALAAGLLCAGPALADSSKVISSTGGVTSVTSPPPAAGPGNSGPVSLGGSTIRPGSTGVDAGSGVRSLPASLITVLVLLGLAAVGGSGIAIRRRVLSRLGA
jgi:hypothetical protein